MNWKSDKTGTALLVIALLAAFLAWAWKRNSATPSSATAPATSPTSMNPDGPRGTGSTPLAPEPITMDQWGQAKAPGNTAPSTPAQLCSTECPQNSVPASIELGREGEEALRKRERLLTLARTDLPPCLTVGAVHALEGAAPGAPLPVTKAFGRLVSVSKTQDGWSLHFHVLFSSPTERFFPAPRCGDFCHGVVAEVPDDLARPMTIISFENSSEPIPPSATTTGSVSDIQVTAPVATWARRLPVDLLPKDKSTDIYVFSRRPLLTTGGIFDAMKELRRRGHERVFWIYPSLSNNVPGEHPWATVVAGPIYLSSSDLQRLHRRRATVIAMDEASKPPGWQGSVTTPAELSLPPVPLEDPSERGRGAFVASIQRQRNTRAFLRRLDPKQNYVLVGEGLADHRPGLLATLLLYSGFPNIYVYPSSGSGWADAVAP